MKLSEITTYDDFLHLKKEWQAILQRSDHTIFSTWEWLSTWWKHFGAGKKMLTLLAEDNGRIIGIAPMMYSVHSMFGLRVGKIEFIGGLDSDYNDFILTERKNECLELFFNHLRKVPCLDSIELRDLPEYASAFQYVAEKARTLVPQHTCIYIPLPDSYERFLKELSRNQRKNLLRTERKLYQNFTVEPINYSDNTDTQIHEAMQILMQLHQKRWNARGFPGVFEKQQVQAFHYDIAKVFSAKKWLTLYMLRLSEKTASVIYGYKYNRKFYGYISGFDPLYQKFNVGRFLRGNIMIKDFIQQGFEEYDFLRGAEEYKNYWNTKSRLNFRAILIKTGIQSELEYLLQKTFWKQGERIKYVILRQR